MRPPLAGGGPGKPEEGEEQPLQGGGAPGRIRGPGQTRGREGLPKLPDRLYFDSRREGLGLDMKSEWSHVWTQCVARFHDCSPEKIPEAVRLLVRGAPDAEPDTRLHGAAVLLVDEEIFRRRKGLRPEQLPDLRYEVLSMGSCAVVGVGGEHPPAVWGRAEHQWRAPHPSHEHFLECFCLHPHGLVRRGRPVLPGSSLHRVEAYSIWAAAGG